MSLIEEIHNQPPLVRQVMYWMALVMVLGVIGFFWVTTAQKNLYFAIHPDPAERAQFVAQQDAHIPQPLATISKVFGSLTASMGGLLGFDNSQGFDKQSGTDHTQDAVHLLPVSQ